MNTNIPTQNNPPPYETYDQRFAKEHSGYDQQPAGRAYPPAQQMQPQGPGYGPIQQNVTIQQQPMAAPGQVIVVSNQQPLPQMGGYIALACVVFWCCNCLFGAIAFFIALNGQSAASVEEARTAGKTSLGVSIAGIIISIIILAIAIPLYIKQIEDSGNPYNDLYN